MTEEKNKYNSVCPSIMRQTPQQRRKELKHYEKLIRNGDKVDDMNDDQVIYNLDFIKMKHAI